MPQRSPLIFWLLLAATLCVDAVAFSQVAGELYPAPPLAVVTIEALLLSQLSVVCIWSAFQTTKSVWPRLAPLAAVLVAALLTAALVPDPVGLQTHFLAGLAHYGLHAALLVAALWLMQRNPFWRRLTGASRQLQFSLASLLAVTTVVAVLAAVLRDSPVFYGERFGVVWKNVAFICCSVALAVFSVVGCWSSALHWFLRVAGVLCFAVLLGAVYSLTFDPFLPMFAIVITSFFLIQAAVLLAWLGWGQIIPESQAYAAGS